VPRSEIMLTMTENHRAAKKGCDCGSEGGGYWAKNEAAGSS